MALIKVSELSSTSSVKIDDILLVSTTSGSGYTSNHISIGDLLSSQPFIDLSSSATSGSSGTSGLNGSSGTSGMNGTSGTSGNNGSSGTSGLDGSSGTSGIDGTNGSSGTSGLGSNVIISDFEPTGQTTGSLWFNSVEGSTYVLYTDEEWIPTNPTLSGSSGTSGINGTSGSSGTSGTSGSSGSSGTSGTSGSNGTSGDSIFVQSGSLYYTTSSILINNNLQISGTTTLGGNIVPLSPRGATLGTLELPFRDLYLQSASINIQSDIIGGRSATISNADGNVTIQAAGFQLKSGSFVSFEVDELGFSRINTPTITTTQAGLMIVGSSDGSIQPAGGISTGRMVHITGNDGTSARFTMDAFGTNSFASFVGRSARGTAASPLPLQVGDIMTRISATGWAESGYNTTNTGGPVTSIDFVATDNYTHDTYGSKIQLYTSPSGSGNIARKLSAEVDSTGLNLPTGSDFKIGGNSYTASLATTGSNNFIGNQTITGSLHLTGSGGVGFINSHRILTDLDTGSFVTTGSNVFISGQTITGSVNITGSLIVTGSLIMDGTLQTYFSHTVTNPSNYVLHQFLTSSYHGGTYAFSAHENSTGKVTVYSNYIVAQGGGGIDAKIGGDSKLESTAGAPNPLFTVGFSGSYAQFKVTDTGTFTYRGIVQIY